MENIDSLDFDTEKGMQLHLSYKKNQKKSEV